MVEAVARTCRGRRHEQPAQQQRPGQPSARARRRPGRIGEPGAAARRSRLLGLHARIIWVQQERSASGHPDRTRSTTRPARPTEVLGHALDANVRFLRRAEEVRLQLDGGEILRALRQVGDRRIACASVGEQDDAGRVEVSRSAPTSTARRCDLPRRAGTGDLDHWRRRRTAPSTVVPSLALADGRAPAVDPVCSIDVLRRDVRSRSCRA